MVVGRLFESSREVVFAGYEEAVKDVTKANNFSRTKTVESREWRFRYCTTVSNSRNCPLQDRRLTCGIVLYSAVIV